MAQQSRRKRWGPHVEYLDKGMVAFALGDRSEAIALWSRALDLAPGNRRALDYLRSVGALPAGVGSANLGTVTSDSILPTADSEVERAADSMVPPFSTTLADGELSGEVIEDITLLLERARKDQAEGRLEQAMEHCQDVFKRDPEHAEAKELADELRDLLIEHYMEDLSPLTQVPHIIADDAALRDVSVGDIGGFLISHITGKASIDQLLSLLGSHDEYRVLWALVQFREQGIIDLKSS